MTLTQSGPKCDVCGSYILLDKSINPFHVKGIDQELHCHDKCKEFLISAGSDYKKLPDGPLKRVFIDHNAKFESEG